jgi:ADP-heptose:LPS heptosyltransferase
LIISIDTSVAHLAGALAKPIWVLLSFTPDWRWLLERNDSPLYPTVQLFSQSDAGAWATVITPLHGVLRDFLNQRTSS